MPGSILNVLFKYIYDYANMRHLSNTRCSIDSTPNTHQFTLSNLPEPIKRWKVIEYSIVNYGPHKMKKTKLFTGPGGRQHKTHKTFTPTMSTTYHKPHMHLFPVLCIFYESFFTTLLNNDPMTLTQMPSKKRMKCLYQHKHSI